jgi:hypothetical protein
MNDDREQSHDFLAGIIIGAIVALCITAFLSFRNWREARRNQRILDRAVRQSEIWDRRAGR